MKKREEIKPYIRKVQYYETDQMGFVHHSNYIRWFEEARIHFMRRWASPTTSWKPLAC